MAPVPERLIVSEPEAKALDEIVVGVALKLAKVPPTVATAATAIAARLRRIFVSGRLLLMVRVSPFSVVDTFTIGRARMETRARQG
jgi:hypothetical protein